MGWCEEGLGGGLWLSSQLGTLGPSELDKYHVIKYNVTATIILSPIHTAPIRISQTVLCNITFTSTYNIKQTLTKDPYR